MSNFITPTDENQPQNSQNLDFSTLAPQIIGEVAHELMHGRFFEETDDEIRFGNRGSFHVDKSEGTFYDHEEQKGGGLLQMICHLCGFEHNHQAIDWLQDKGYLDGTHTPTQRSRLTRQHRSQGAKDMFQAGLKLWQEAEPIPFYQYHPVRRWCNLRNLFPSYRELPPTIHWHEEKRYIIVLLATVQDFVAAYPESPKPRQFHLISIDKRGRKGNAFKNGDDKRTWGQPGVTCVALFGNPNAGEIGICEGMADALSLTSDFGCVIASVTALNKIANDETSLKCLLTQEVYLCGDNDDAGRKGQANLANALKRLGGEIFYVEKPTAKDPAAAAGRRGGHEN